MAVCLLLSLLWISSACFAQKEPDPVWYDKYYKNRYSTYDYLQVAEKVGWVPRREGLSKGSMQVFEAAFIEITRRDGVLKSMLADGAYFCSLNHDYLRERYNRTYKPVSQAIWDEYCPILYVLMDVDKK